MTEDPKTAALTELEEAAAPVRLHEEQRLKLAAAIVKALNAGAKPTEVADRVPYDRNHVRRIARAGGVQARKKPTVVAKPKPEAPSAE